MDQHQLVVVQNEVVKLRHPAECIVAYPRQSVAADKTERENGETDYSDSHLSAAFHATPIKLETHTSLQLYANPYLLRCRALRFSRSAKA